MRQSMREVRQALAAVVAYDAAVTLDILDLKDAWELEQEWVNRDLLRHIATRLGKLRDEYRHRVRTNTTLLKIYDRLEPYEQQVMNTAKEAVLVLNQALAVIENYLDEDVT